MDSDASVFATFYLNGWIGGYYTIHSIEEDKWIPGNILATVGSAIYTVDSSGSATLLIGSKYITGNRKEGNDGLLNGTSGLFQMQNGKELIISDKFNHCLRKLDRETKNITTFAGECRSSKNDTSSDGRCVPQGDSPIEETVFCNPDLLRHSERENTLLVLDKGYKEETCIRSINLSTSQVSTLYQTDSFTALDYFVVEETNSLVFLASNGIVQINLLTGSKQWLIGCEKNSSEADCEGFSNMSFSEPYAFIKLDDNIIVSGEALHVFNLESKSSLKLTANEISDYYSFRDTAAIALIDKQLFVGIWVSYLSADDYYYYEDYEGRGTAIFKINLPLSNCQGK